MLIKVEELRGFLEYLFYGGSEVNEVEFKSKENFNVYCVSFCNINVFIECILCIVIILGGIGF